MLTSFIHNSRAVFEALTSFSYAVNVQYGYDVKIVAILESIGPNVGCVTLEVE